MTLGQLVRVDLNTNSILGSPINVGTGAYAVAVNPNTNKVYVTKQPLFSAPSPSIVVIDDSSVAPPPGMPDAEGNTEKPLGWTTAGRSISWQ